MHGTSKHRPHHCGKGNFWTADQVSSLISWMKDGFSHGEISRKLWETFGVLHSRNSCCGKAFRLGLKSMRTVKRDAVEKRITDRRERDRIRQRKQRAEKGVRKPKPDAPIQIDLKALRCVE